jgi:hypothetical protein
MSSNASNMNHLSSIIKPRNKNLGLNLNNDQSSIATPSNLKSEIIIVPATSSPSFGSYFIFDVKERNCLISDLVINFNIGSIGGVSSAPTSYPHFVPLTFLLTKVELVVNNVCVDTLYPIQQYVGEKAIDELTLKAFVGSRTSSMFEDAGEGYGYQNGDSNARTFTTDSSERQFTIQQNINGNYASAHKTIRLEFIGLEFTPTQCLCDGTPAQWFERAGKGSIELSIPADFRTISFE